MDEREIVDIRAALHRAQKADMEAMAMWAEQYGDRVMDFLADPETLEAIDPK